MARAIRLLLIEDSELDAELIVMELRRHGYTLEHLRVDDMDALRSALTERTWDLVLCDHGIPSFDSSAALVAARDLSPDVPFVILSGTIGEEAAVAALKAGARDVVLKTNLARMGPVVDRELHEAQARRAQRAAERARLESDARKAAILESALDAIVSMDHEGRVVDFNPAAEAMFGYAREAAVGEPIAALIVPPRLRERHEQGLARYLATGRSPIIGRRLELTGMRADGGEFPVEVSITRLDIPGNPPLFTAYLRDLTERARAEQERAALEEQLRHAQKMEAVGRLVGGVTHDFNNLLSAVTGFSELVLLRLAPDDPNRADLEEIHAAGLRAAALTRQLLAFSRKQILQPEPLNLSAVLVGLAPLLERVVGDPVEVVLEPAADLLPIRADPGQLEQVIVNLAVNARDAMPDGGRLTLRTADLHLPDDDPVPRGARHGRFSTLEVADTGVGIDADARDRIFDPFFTTKEPGKGTGLGLSTVHGIVQQSDGFVLVDSAPGRGSRFRVCLPVTDAAAADDPAPPAPAGPAGGTETLVVVDDDPSLLRLLHDALTQHGYTVLVAESGPEALALCAAHDGPIDLLITDMRMPAMTGAELRRRLAAQRPALKALFISGYSEEGLEDVLREHPAGFLQKPFALDALRDEVRHLLDRSA